MMVSGNRWRQSWGQAFLLLMFLPLCCQGSSVASYPIHFSGELTDVTRIRCEKNIPNVHRIKLSDNNSNRTIAKVHTTETTSVRFVNVSQGTLVFRGHINNSSGSLEVYMNSSSSDSFQPVCEFFDGSHIVTSVSADVRNYRAVRVCCATGNTTCASHRSFTTHADDLHHNDDDVSGVCQGEVRSIPLRVKQGSQSIPLTPVGDCRQAPEANGSSPEYYQYFHPPNWDPVLYRSSCAEGMGQTEVYMLSTKSETRNTFQCFVDTETAVCEKELNFPSDVPQMSHMLSQAESSVPVIAGAATFGVVICLTVVVIVVVVYIKRRSRPESSDEAERTSLQTSTNTGSEGSRETVLTTDNSMQQQSSIV